MGLITKILGNLSPNVDVKSVIETLRPNAENSDAREFEIRKALVDKAFSDMDSGENTWFDQVINGMNRLPRPLLALSVIALFGSAMTDPVWFSARMQGLALVPEPLWWLMGVIVSFYFGARHQLKSQSFQKDILKKAAASNAIVEGIVRTEELASTRAAKEEGVVVPQEKPHKVERKEVTAETRSATAFETFENLWKNHLSAN